MPVTFTVIELAGATIISFLIGFASGFIVGRKTPEEGGPDIRVHIAVFITVVWAISVLATIVVTNYETSIWVHAIMGAICGYLFGVENPLFGGFNGNG